MFRFLRIAGFVLAAMLLAGCASSLKVPLLGSLPLPASFDNAPAPSRSAALKRLKTETPCCRTWSDLPFHDVLPQQPRKFRIDKFSPVADLDGERTHFLTFILPSYKKPYRVVVQAQPSAHGLSNSFLLAPTITLLNANYKPIASKNVSLCVYINWRPSMSGGFGAVTVKNRNAQYLVVTTSKKQLAATTYWSQSPTSFNNVDLPSNTGLGSVASAPVTSGSFEVPHGPEGTLYIGKMTPAYASAVANGICGGSTTASLFQ